MTKTQNDYIKIRLTILGFVGAFVCTILGICFDWLFIEALLGIACMGALAWLIAYWWAQIIYRWRVMGATEEHEADLFDYYWFFTIKTGRIDEMISSLEEDPLNYREDAIKYLYKIREVKIPKILK